MNMHTRPGEVHVTLSRRNLQSLLAKLDGHPKHSFCTLMRHTDCGILFVEAVEDSEEYAYRTAGPVHPVTEKRIAETKRAEVNNG